MIKTYLRRLLSLSFWKRHWRAALIAAAGLVAVILICSLLIGTQEDIGAQEAGHQVAQLAQNIRNRYKTRLDYWGLSTTEVINKKIYPLSMIVSDTELRGYFGGIVEVGSDENGTPIMPTVKTFAVAYKDLTAPQCLVLASYKFDQNFWLGVQAMVISNDSGATRFDWSTNNLVLPAAKSTVKPLCKALNTIIFYFD